MPPKSRRPIAILIDVGVTPTSDAARAALAVPPLALDWPLVTGEVDPFDADEVPAVDVVGDDAGSALLPSPEPVASIPPPATAVSGSRAAMRKLNPASRAPTTNPMS